MYMIKYIDKLPIAVADAHEARGNLGNRGSCRESQQRRGEGSISFSIKPQALRLTLTIPAKAARA